MLLLPRNTLYGRQDLRPLDPAPSLFISPPFTTSMVSHHTYLLNMFKASEALILHASSCFIARITFFFLKTNRNLCEKLSVESGGRQLRSDVRIP